MIKKILIVDDSRAARIGLRSWLLKDREYEIREAGNGKEALEQFNEFKPDLTFLDLTMPVMDGFEALEKIKQINPNAIVLVLTADIQKRTIERVSGLGAFKVLKKPPVKDVIHEALSEVRKYLEEDNLK